MTTLAPPAELAIPPASVRRSRRVRTRTIPLTARWLVLLAACAIAFHSSATEIARQVRAGDDLWYLADVPLFGVVMAVGIERRRGEELAIFDRQVDWIIAVGGGGLLALVAMLLAPRIAGLSAFVLLDVPEAVLFSLLCALLLFGTRPTLRFYAMWFALLCTTPLLYRVGAVAVGAQPTHRALLTVGYGAIALAVAIGRPAPRVVIGVVLGVALGIGAVVALRTGGHADLQYEPALVEVLGGYTLSCLHRPGRGPTRHGRRRPLAVTRLSPAAVALVLIGAGLVALRPDSPPAALSSPPVLVSIGVTPGDLLPAGWRLVGTEVNAWPPAYFGIGASFVRYLLAPPANSGMHEAAVDVTTGPDLAPFLVFPTIYTYAYASPVSVSTRPVLPGRGIVAALDYTNSSELTSADSGEWAMESILWRVEVGGYYERVAVSSLAGSGSGILPVPAAPFRNGSFRAVLANILRGQPPVATGSPPPRAVATVGRLVAHLVAAQQVIER